MVDAVDSGTYTPETIARRQKIAEMLLGNSLKQRPMHHWAEPIAQAMQAGTAGYLLNETEKEAQAGQKAQNDALLAMLGGGGTQMPAPTSSPPTTTAAPQAVSPMGSLPGLDDAIKGAASKYGIDPEYLRKTAMIESGGGRNLSSPLSSAKGPFQFIDSTAKQYGLTDPNDPVQSADAAARLALDNKNVLTQVLGREPTPGELYLAHQQGAGGAAKLLQNPDQPATSLLGQRAIINNGGSPAMTGAQFAQGFTRKFDDQGIPPNAQPAQYSGQNPVAAALANPAAGALPSGVTDNKAAIAKMLSSPNPFVQDMGRKLATGIIQKQLTGESPTNDIKEYQLAKQQGFTGTLLDYQTKLKEAGKPVTNINQQQESEYEKATGKQLADANMEIIKSAGNARGKIATLNRLDTLLKDQSMYTGAGGQGVLELKRIGKAIGVDVGDVGPAEAAKSISNQFALELRNPSGGAGMPGAMSDKDREFLQSMVPGLGQNPQGNTLIIDYMKRVAQRSVDVERLRQQYVKKNGRLTEGFYNELADWSDAHPLFSEDDMKKAAVAPPAAGGGANIDDLLRKYGGK